MTYELKFYFEENANKLSYLGNHSLADEYTYQHYLDLLKSKIRFNIWFDFLEGEFIHRNFEINEKTDFREGKIVADNENTKAIFIITNDINDLLFLTDSEFKKQDRISELINQLSKEDLTKYFNN